GAKARRRARAQSAERAEQGGSRRSAARNFRASNGLAQERAEGADDGAAQEESQSGLHDQRRRRVVPSPSADAAALRARRTAEAFSLAGQHAPLHRLGPRTTGSNSQSHARTWRQSGGD